MKAKTLIRVSGMILLATVVSLFVLVVVYALQSPNLILMLATVSWNGAVSY
jgi:hypothetical protein